MNIDFYKYQGTGNDFIIIDNRSGMFNTSPDNLKFLCSRKFGIGADGLMLLEKHDLLDFSMKYFNANGIESSMCGNGGRCMVAFAGKINLIAKNTTFEAIDGMHQATIITDGYVKLKMQDISSVSMKNDSWYLNTGSPHYVTFVENIDKIDVYNDGRLIQGHKDFAPDGTNVNFVELNKDQDIFVRTYERGVENETLSCGTGVIASAISTALKQKTDKNSFRVATLGGVLKVTFTRVNDSFLDVWLEGPATFVFKGTITM